MCLCVYVTGGPEQVEVKLDYSLCMDSGGAK